MMQRRLWLQGGLAATALALAPASLWAVGVSRPRLLVVFLRGGYDAASLLVPLRSTFYLESRPQIAIAAPSADPLSSVALDADWGLHPALRSTLHPMYQRGELAFIPFAGSDDLSRSHFETQDTLELGQALGRTRDYRSGFLNRLAAVLQDAPAMAFTDRLPVALQGSVQVPNTSLRTISRPGLDARQSGLIASMYQGTGLAASVRDGFQVRDEVMREMSAEMEAASRNAVSARGFELEARRVARLMREHYSLGFLDVGGWDTHVNQGAATGYLANQLEDLGRGLASYAAEMGPLWQETTVLVVSEFGRTLRQNGNRGTDHGHGTVYWVLGGGVRGGRVVGNQVPVAADTLFQNRDFPVLNEFRGLMAGLLARLYGLRESQLQAVFPGAVARDLGLL